MTEERDKVRPDEVLPPDSAAVQTRHLVSDTVLMIPNLLRLISGLLRDPRVPRRAKVGLGLAAAYVLSPIDLIPEIIPVIGWADDILILVFAIDSLIEKAGSEIVEEHWNGPGDLLKVVRDVVGMGRSVLPKRVSSMLDRLYG